MKLKNLVGLLDAQRWEVVKGSEEWKQAGFLHKCAGWNRARRFVAVRQLVKIEKGLFAMPVYEYFCYVTTERITPIEAHRCYGKRATCETWIEECKGQMNAGHLRTGEFLANAALFQCAVNSIQSFEMDGDAYRRCGTTMGSKDGEIVVNPCGRETDNRKQAVDLKVTGEISPSGRMAGMGRHVAEGRIWIEGNWCL